MGFQCGPNKIVGPGLPQVGAGGGRSSITPAKPIPSAGYHKGQVDIAVEEFCTGRMTPGSGYDAQLDDLLGERDLSMRTRGS